MAEDFVIEMLNITKEFPGIKANDNITLQLRKGEVHALLGENGAGKSTLMSVLFGLYQPEQGVIKKNGKEVKINNPNDANDLGIGMVHQHFMLVNQLTVLENIILGKESGGFLLNRKESRKKVEELVERFGFRLPLDEKVENLSVGMKQRVEILKTLYRGADIIILDEPTAVLTPQEVEELFKILRQLKKNGKTIIFITHKLNETMSLSDRITVIRKGKVVFNCDTCDTNEKELATQMVGRQVESIVTKAEDPHGPVVLELKNVRLHKRAQETVSIQVHAGEIFGIAGVDGNGQQELEEMIVGNRKTEEGTISMNGKEVQNLSVKERKAMGLGYIPSDRHKDAMVPDFSITENFLLGYQEDPKYCKKGFIDYKALEEDAKVQVEQFEIKIAGVSQHIGQLSGGNQQKAIIAREIDKDPKLLVAVQPTRGLDVGAIEYIHRQIVAERDKGTAVLLVSLELDEVMNLSDRILVMYEGEVVGEFDPKTTTVQELGLYMAGARKQGKESK